MISFLSLYISLCLVAFIGNVAYLVFAFFTKRCKRRATFTLVTSFLLLSGGMMLRANASHQADAASVSNSTDEYSNDTDEDDDNEDDYDKTAKIRQINGVGNPDSMGDYKVTLSNTDSITITGTATPNAKIDVVSDYLEDKNAHSDNKGNFKMTMHLNAGKKNEYLITANKDNYNESDVVSITVSPEKTAKQQSSQKESNAESSTKTESAKTSSSKPSSVSHEEANALLAAIDYASNGHSKQRIYKLLVSPYANKFSPEAAQYAIDHLTGFDWNENALLKAKQYQESHLSKSRIYDVLTSANGEQFTSSEAQYAIDHLDE